MRRCFGFLKPQRGEIIRLKDSTRAGYFAPSKLWVVGDFNLGVAQAFTLRAFGASFE